jgi:uncharacterized SAM-binding protein YcdF (DUF218 family)
MDKPEPDTRATMAQQHDGHGSRRRLAVRALVIALCALLVVFAGFLAFWQRSHGLALMPASKPVGDGIVVLTGGPERISTGVRLLQENAGQRLLITGVHPQTTASQIRLITGTERDLFRCCIDLDKAATDTRGNAAETRRWAMNNNFSKLVIVTSDYHMLRTLMEFSRAMPAVELAAHPVEGSDGRDPWSSLASARLWFSEYVKYLLALVRLEAGY